MMCSKQQVSDGLEQKYQVQNLGWARELRVETERLVDLAATENDFVLGDGRTEGRREGEEKGKGKRKEPLRLSRGERQRQETEQTVDIQRGRRRERGLLAISIGPSAVMLGAEKQARRTLMEAGTQTARVLVSTLTPGTAVRPLPLASYHIDLVCMPGTCYIACYCMYTNYK